MARVLLVPPVVMPTNSLSNNCNVLIGDIGTGADHVRRALEHRLVEAEAVDVAAGSGTLVPLNHSYSKARAGVPEGAGDTVVTASRRRSWRGAGLDDVVQDRARAQPVGAALTSSSRTDAGNVQQAFAEHHLFRPGIADKDAVVGGGRNRGDQRVGGHLLRAESLADGRRIGYLGQSGNVGLERSEHRQIGYQRLSVTGAAEDHAGCFAERDCPPDRRRRPVEYSIW